MTNKYTGEVEIQLGGKTLKLVYDFRALSKITSKHGKDALQTILQGLDVDLIASVLHIGLVKHQPLITIEEIMEASPPVVPMIKAIDEAMTYALYGAEGQPEAVEPEKK